MAMQYGFEMFICSTGQGGNKVLARWVQIVSWLFLVNRLSCDFQSKSIMHATWPAVGPYDKILVQSSQYLMDAAHDFRKRLKAYTATGKGKVCTVKLFRGHLKRRPIIGFQYRLMLNEGQKYCRMLQGEHSAILSTFIKLPFVIKIFVLSILEWLFKTGFIVVGCYIFLQSI